MNTVKKGNILEENAINIIKKYIEDGYFGPKDYLSLHSKKKYSSQRRNGEIEFDLSIEFKLPNMNKPSLTYFIECKNYMGRLPVEKVKKFKADIDEVSGINVKGILISSSELQTGAYDYAEAYGIMVLVGQSIEKHKIILPRKNKTQEAKIPFLKKSKDYHTKESGLLIVEKQIDNAILSAFIETTSHISFGIDKLSKAEITKIANTELNKIGIEFLEKGYGLETKHLIPFLKREYNIDVVYSTQIKNLGEINISENKIVLNKTIQNTSRELFILAHEYGHYILHSNLSINNQLYNSFEDTISSFNKKNLKNPKQWIEWQANYFSASLLMPHSSILVALWKTQVRLNLRKGNLILNDNNYNEVNEIINKIAYLLNCSKKSVLIRLNELKLIDNNSHLKRINELIPETLDKADLII